MLSFKKPSTNGRTDERSLFVLRIECVSYTRLTRRTLVNEPSESHSANRHSAIRQQKKRISIFLRSNYDLLGANFLFGTLLSFRRWVRCWCRQIRTRARVTVCVSVGRYTSIRNNFHHHFCQGVRFVFFMMSINTLRIQQKHKNY